jgi:hypothetical protein
MSPFINANLINYDITYPPVAQCTNTEARINVMEQDIGKDVMFQIEDKIQFYGKIASVPNAEHYCVIVDRNGTPWEWYVRVESIHFIEDIGHKI